MRRTSNWVFIDFKQAYDSVHRPAIVTIMEEFGVPSKLIRLTKLCISNTRSKVRVGNKETNIIDIVSGLKQGCLLSCMIFNLVMEKTIRSVRDMNAGIDIGENTINNLAYADDWTC